MMGKTYTLHLLASLILNLLHGSASGLSTQSSNGDTGFNVQLNIVNDGIIGPNCKGQEVNASMMINAVESCTMEKEMDKVEANTTDKPDASETSSLVCYSEFCECFTACLWKKLELVGQDMMFTQDVTHFVIGTFPPNVQPQVMDAMTKCAADNKWPVSMEDNCNSYGSMRKCIMDAVVEICRGS